jgi:co-chaperonin GroES (HSP10)
MSDIRPLKTNLLVRVLKPEEKVTAEGIHIPASHDEPLIRGEILDVGPQVSSQGAYAIGDICLFLKDSEQSTDVGSDRFLVSESTVVAVESAESQTKPFEASAFFAIPPWNEFEGTDFASWQEFQNITLFMLKAQFLHPFRTLAHLAPVIHAEIVNAMRSVKGLEMHRIKYAKKDESYTFIIEDDTWNVAFILREDSGNLELRKLGTSVENLHLTLPTFLTAFQRVLTTTHFKAILGADYSSLTDVVFRFHQRIHIEGKGTAKAYIKNSDLMQQFLRLVPARGETTPATLESLGFKRADLGRIDLKFSFEKEIKNHEYRIFVNIEAPANDQYRFIDIEWEIQDLAPGVIDGREYGPVFTDFFKNVVLRGFYHRWFKDPEDIVCTTLKS